MDRKVLVERAIPTDPAVRSSDSLFLTETHNQGDATRSLLEVAVVTPPPPIAERMGPGETIVRRRLMSVDGVPVRLANSYFPASAPEAAALKAGDFIDGGLQKLFEARRFGTATETLVARPPTAQERQLLELEPDEPVVQIVRTSFDNLGTAVHTLETICAACRHVFVVNQLPGDSAF
jgi:GntR family transcriptional regulator